jgi:hypothetical protein
MTTVRWDVRSPSAEEHEQLIKICDKNAWEVACALSGIKERKG